MADPTDNTAPAPPGPHLSPVDDVAPGWGGDVTWRDPNPGIQREHVVGDEQSLGYWQKAEATTVPLRQGRRALELTQLRATISRPPVVEGDIDAEYQAAVERWQMQKMGTRRGLTFRQFTQRMTLANRDGVALFGFDVQLLRYPGDTKRGFRPRPVLTVTGCVQVPLYRLDWSRPWVRDEGGAVVGWRQRDIGPDGVFTSTVTEVTGYLLIVTHDKEGGDPWGTSQHRPANLARNIAEKTRLNMGSAVQRAANPKKVLKDVEGAHSGSKKVRDAATRAIRQAQKTTGGGYVIPEGMADGGWDSPPAEGLRAGNEAVKLERQDLFDAWFARDLAVGEAGKGAFNLAEHLGNVRQNMAHADLTGKLEEYWRCILVPLFALNWETDNACPGFKVDGILPDRRLEQWQVEQARQMVDGARRGRLTRAEAGAQLALLDLDEAQVERLLVGIDDSVAAEARAQATEQEDALNGAQVGAAGQLLAQAVNFVGGRFDAPAGALPPDAVEIGLVEWYSMSPDRAKRLVAPIRSLDIPPPPAPEPEPNPEPTEDPADPGALADTPPNQARRRQALSGRELRDGEQFMNPERIERGRTALEQDAAQIAESEAVRMVVEAFVDNFDLNAPGAAAAVFDAPDPDLSTVAPLVLRVVEQAETLGRRLTRDELRSAGVDDIPAGDTTDEPADMSAEALADLEVAARARYGHLIAALCDVDVGDAQWLAITRNALLQEWGALAITDEDDGVRRQGLVLRILRSVGNAIRNVVGAEARQRQVSEVETDRPTLIRRAIDVVRGVFRSEGQPAVRESIALGTTQELVERGVQVVEGSNSAESATCRPCERDFDGRLFVVGSRAYHRNHPPFHRCESIASGVNKCNCRFTPRPDLSPDDPGVER